MRSFDKGALLALTTMLDTITEYEQMARNKHCKHILAKIKTEIEIQIETIKKCID